MPRTGTEPRPHTCSITPLCAALAALAALGCVQAPLVIEASPDPAITVDGAYEDWHGRFTRIGGRRSVGLGIANDAESLYLCLVTRDFGVQTLLRKGGFTLWLDPEGGEVTRIGIRVAPVESGGGAGAGAADAAGDEPLSPRVEIVRDGAEYGYQLARPGPDAPVDVRTAQHADVVVYEFRLALGEPLSGTGPGSLRTRLEPGPSLGIGVVTETFAPPDDGRGMRGRNGIEPLRAWVVGRLVGV